MLRKQDLRKSLLLLPLMLAVLISFPLVKAFPDPFSTLTVWPLGTPEGAEGPIVTTSPADLIIYNTDDAHVLTDLWLMLVINEPAFDHLSSISTNTSLTFLPAHFTEIDGIVSPSHKIPLSPPGSETHPAYGSWPGMEPDDQYNVGSIRSKLEIPKITDSEYESMYYAVGDLDSSSGWIDHGPTGLDKTDPEFFTVTVDLGGWGGNWKVLVLALGYTQDGAHTQEFMLNVHSPYTRSTLIVPELSTILLAIASLSAFGLHGIRHKFRKK